MMPYMTKRKQTCKPPAEVLAPDLQQSSTVSWRLKALALPNKRLQYPDLGPEATPDAQN